MPLALILCVCVCVCVCVSIGVYEGTWKFPLVPISSRRTHPWAVHVFQTFFFLLFSLFFFFFFFSLPWQAQLELLHDKAGQFGVTVRMTFPKFNSSSGLRMALSLKIKVMTAKSRKINYRQPRDFADGRLEQTRETFKIERTCVFSWSSSYNMFRLS